MSYFKKEFVDFFKELSKNNSSEWFAANRKRYEQAVKEPFAQFVGEVIRKVQKVDPEVKIKPGDAITRINKDIRFSKDKTPYNTYVGAVISPAGKKDKSVPGLYVQLSAEKVTLFGGAYVLEPPQLKKVREKIMADPKTFAKLYGNKTFKDLFGGIKGEQSKRLDPALAKAAEREPLVANKQFYFSTELKPALITKEELADTVFAHYQAAREMNKFLQNALK